MIVEVEGSESVPIFLVTDVLVNVASVPRHWQVLRLQTARQVLRVSASKIAIVSL
jgi:hypothetical protein